MPTYTDPRKPLICIEDPSAHDYEYIVVPLYLAVCDKCKHRYAVDDSMCEKNHGEDGRLPFSGWIVGSYYSNTKCKCGGSLRISGKTRESAGEKYLVRSPREVAWTLSDGIPGPQYKNVTKRYTGRDS